MIACPNCSHVNANDARFCAECQAPMQKTALAVRGPVTLSENAALAAEARQRYQDSAPSSTNLSPQAWYNLAKFYPTIARKASELHRRPLPSVGPNNPLDRTASSGFAPLRRHRKIRQREPGEDDE